MELIFNCPMTKRFRYFSFISLSKLKGSCCVLPFRSLSLSPGVDIFIMAGEISFSARDNGREVCASHGEGIYQAY